MTDRPAVAAPRNPQEEQQLARLKARDLDGFAAALLETIRLYADTEAGRLGMGSPVLAKAVYSGIERQIVMLAGAALEAPPPPEPSAPDDKCGLDDMPTTEQVAKDDAFHAAMAVADAGLRADTAERRLRECENILVNLLGDVKDSAGRAERAYCKASIDRAQNYLDGYWRGDAPPSGPWIISGPGNYAPGYSAKEWIVRREPNPDHRPGQIVDSEAEAIAVRDALNRVACGAVPPREEPPHE